MADPNSINYISFDKEENTATVFGVLSVSLPGRFELMDSEKAKQKYPSDFRPPVLLTEINGTTDIGFHYLKEDALSNDKVEDVTESLRSIIKRMYPTNKFYAQDVIESQNTKVGYFEYTNPSNNLFYSTFITPIDEKTLIGSLNCPAKAKLQWKDKALEMLKSFMDETLIEQIEEVYR